MANLRLHYTNTFGSANCPNAADFSIAWIGPVSQKHRTRTIRPAAA